MVLRHTDNLSKTLQIEDTSAAQGQQVAELVKKTLESLRADTHASSFWKCVTTKATKLDVSEPCLPRKRKRPARCEDGEAAAEFSHLQSATTELLYTTEPLI